MLRKILQLFMISFSLLFSSCSTTTKTTLLGMGVGVSTGAITGAVMQKDKKGIMLGALAFGLLGAVTGYFSHGALDKRDKRVRKETIFNLEKYGVQDFSRNDFEDYKSSTKKDVYILTDDPNFFK